MVKAALPDNRVQFSVPNGSSQLTTYNSISRALSPSSSPQVYLAPPWYTDVYAGKTFVHI